MEIALCVLLGLAIAGLVVSPLILNKAQTKTIQDLNDRIAAKDLEQFKYWNEVYPKAVADQGKKEKDLIKERKKFEKKATPADRESREAARAF